MHVTIGDHAPVVIRIDVCDKNNFGQRTSALRVWRNDKSHSQRCRARHSGERARLQRSFSRPYTGIKFVLGIPDAQNYVNAATQPSPLNLTSLFWGWTTGYKFARIEGSTTGMSNGFLFHLGNPICAPNTPRADCLTYRPEIVITGADPTAQTIDANLARLFTDVNMDVDGVGAPGCMSDPSDTTCAAIFAKIGIPATTSQTFFQWAN